MASVYSARFMVGYGKNRQEKYVVPANKRAVVRFCSFGCFSASTISAFLYVHGIPVVLWSPPGAATSTVIEGRWVCYAGETIIVVVGNVDMSYAVDGHLFDDPNGRPDDADNVIIPMAFADPLPVIETWPAGLRPHLAA